jgi:hypothetical protein
MKVISSLSCIVIISLLLWSPSVSAQSLDQDNPIYKELADQGRMMT